MTIATPLSISAILAAVLLAGACTDEATDPAVEFRSSTSGTSWGCSDCPVNSPHVNNFGVSELNLDGILNDDSLELIGIVDNNEDVYQLDFIGDELVARDASLQVVAVGPGLIGWRIALFNADEATTEYIHIRGFTTLVPSRANNGAFMSGYALAYLDPDDIREFKNVCPDVHDDPDAIAVTAIGGETYDKGSKTVNIGMSRWLTLACADEATYKMKQMGYSPNIIFSNGQPSTRGQRQATLKMLTADYCGDGTSYTEHGTRVTWLNTSGSVGTYPTDVNAAGGSAVEALWNENGALCLDEQRFPELVAACGLAACDTVPVTKAREWATWVPPEAP